MRMRPFMCDWYGRYSACRRCMVVCNMHDLVAVLLSVLVSCAIYRVVSYASSLFLPAPTGGVCQTRTTVNFTLQTLDAA